MKEKRSARKTRLCWFPHRTEREQEDQKEEAWGKNVVTKERDRVDVPRTVTLTFAL